VLDHECTAALWLVPLGLLLLLLAAWFLTTEWNDPQNALMRVCFYYFQTLALVTPASTNTNASSAVLDIFNMRVSSGSSWGDHSCLWPGLGELASTWASLATPFLLVLFVFVALRLEGGCIWLRSCALGRLAQARQPAVDEQNASSSSDRSQIMRVPRQDAKVGEAIMAGIDEEKEVEETEEEENEAETQERASTALLQPLLPPVGSSSLQASGGTSDRLSRRLRWHTSPDSSSAVQLEADEGSAATNDTAAADDVDRLVARVQFAAAPTALQLPSHSFFRQSFRKWKALTTLLLITYSVVTETCMSLLRCVSVAGLPGSSDGSKDGTHSELRLMLSPQQVQCFEPWQKLLIAIVVLVLAPFPLVLFAWVRRHQRKEKHTHARTNKNTLGAELAILRVLEGPFKQSAMARNWELVVLCRRFTLLALYTLLVLSPFWQDLALALCNVAILAAHLLAAPYKKPLEQRAETASLGLLVLASTLNFGMGVEGGEFGGKVFSDKFIQRLQLQLLLVPLGAALLLLVLTTMEARGVLRAGFLSSKTECCVGADFLVICINGDDGGGGEVNRAWENEELRGQLEAKDTQLEAKDMELEANATQLEANATQLEAKDTQLEAKDMELEAEKQETNLLLLELGELRGRGKARGTEGDKQTSGRGQYLTVDQPIPRS
jgi:hypothetical protein